ncbi:fibronectin type III domain-containing protein 4 isoform X1 [Falco naumanni]|uniref:fibronectin type III domain-containing protein 4 isoform X1 n=1 Tax=Falco naumanni TaxID=148594 RepID=UPI001ADE7D17|nr:fibronectin type III domain-containing protein 4 isoform X1 [Falco naumanni]
MSRFSAFLNPVLLLFSCDLCLVRANRPPSPVNVTVTQLKANSATVSWDVPEGDVVIGYAILQQRQDGQMQRFIREVNTTNRACVLWDLAEDADYIIQVQSIGLYGESQASKRVHFRTLKETDRLPSNSSNQGDITMEGLDKDRQLQTGEIIIIVAVLLMWAGECHKQRSSRLGQWCNPGSMKKMGLERVQRHISMCLASFPVSPLSLCRSSSQWGKRSNHSHCSAVVA